MTEFNLEVMKVQTTVYLGIRGTLEIHFLNSFAINQPCILGNICAQMQYYRSSYRLAQAKLS